MLCCQGFKLVSGVMRIQITVLSCQFEQSFQKLTQQRPEHWGIHICLCLHLPGRLSHCPRQGLVHTPLRTLPSYLLPVLSVFSSPPAFPIECFPSSCRRCTTDPLDYHDFHDHHHHYHHHHHHLEVQVDESSVKFVPSTSSTPTMATMATLKLIRQK